MPKSSRRLQWTDQDGRRRSLDEVFAEHLRLVCCRLNGRESHRKDRVSRRQSDLGEVVIMRGVGHGGLSVRDRGPAVEE